MTKENMDRSRRQQSASYAGRHDAYHTHKDTSRTSRRSDETGPRLKRKERDHSETHSSDHHQRESVNRREWRGRNSPIVLVHQRPSTDSSSNNEESDGRRDDRKRRNREREESFEELSRRKKKIESELHALDAAEAASKGEAGRKQRSHNRNPSEQKRGDHSNHHRNARVKGPERHAEAPVRIKKEPTSDDERRRNRQRSDDSHRQTEGNQPREENADWGQPSEPPAKPKEKPNFKTSGKLAEDTNTYNGVVIKYNEPSEARKPKRKWRLYPFKGTSDLPFIPVHRQSAYLLGRTRTIADIPIDHPSCSKQHAVLQFRATAYKKDDGSTGRRVRPYIIDLESANGTFVNNKKVDPRCYVELLERDVLKFGFSTREYVILHEDSKHADDIDSN